MALSSPAAADAPPPVDEEPRWGLGDAALGWALGNLGAALLGSLVVVAAGYTLAQAQDGDIPLWVNAAQFPTLWAGFIGVPVWAAATKGNGVVKDFGLRVRAADVPLGLFVGVLAQLVMVPAVTWAIVHAFDIDPDKMGEIAQKMGDRATNPAGVILLFLTAAVGAPFAEELLFRGLFLRALEKRFDLVVAVVGSSVIFGAAHLEPLQFLPLALAGLIFALLAVRSGRLGPAIFAHIGFNATALVGVIWFP